MKGALVFLVGFLVVGTTVGSPVRGGGDSIQRDRRDLNAIQTKLVQLLNPQPVVDKIVSEKEKFGNIGNHPFAKKIQTTFEGISRVFSTALDVPAQKVKMLSKGTTEFLDQIGAKLVGLQ